MVEMNPVPQKKIYLIIGIVVLMAISFFVGHYRGQTAAHLVPTITGINGEFPTDADFTEFWKVWTLLNEKHVSADTVTDKQKVYGAIKGLADSFGDPYTVFFPPVESKMFESEISGNFEGVGMEVGKKDNVLTVIAPLKLSPAERAGIKAGDLIIQINGTTTQNLSVDEAVTRIRGKRGTPVSFTLIREGVKEPFEIEVVRDTINIPTINTEYRKADGVFVISLYSFTGNSPQLFRNALRSFISSGTNKLILDMRGNPGGYLEAAVDMASWFLPVGKTIVTEDFKGKAEPVVYKSKGYNIFNNKLKMAILIDKGSASASEILAGALSEQSVAKLVGTKSFGKGSVQELVPIGPDTSLKVTIARWLTPLGNSISDGGLTPDIVAELATSTAPGATEDIQMQKAIELLKSE
jgi:carboxyl-terminal processing protease